MFVSELPLRYQIWGSGGSRRRMDTYACLPACLRASCCSPASHDIHPFPSRNRPARRSLQSLPKQKIQFFCCRPRQCGLAVRPTARPRPPPVQSASRSAPRAWTDGLRRIDDGNMDAAAAAAAVGDMVAAADDPRMTASNSSKWGGDVRDKKRRAGGWTSGEMPAGGVWDIPVSGDLSLSNPGSPFHAWVLGRYCRC